MDQPTPDDVVLGVKISTLVASFLGAAISLSSTPTVSPRRALIAVVSGTIIGAAGAPLLLHWSGLGDPLERFLSFFCGLVGLRAIPVLFAWVDRAKDAKLPTLPDVPKDGPP